MDEDIFFLSLQVIKNAFNIFYLNSSDFNWTHVYISRIKQLYDNKLRYSILNCYIAFWTITQLLIGSKLFLLFMMKTQKFTFVIKYCKIVWSVSTHLPEFLKSKIVIATFEFVYYKSRFGKLKWHLTFMHVFS